MVADIQQRLKNMKSRTASDPDIIHTYWLDKLTAIRERYR